jgi:hypothetical protein
VGKDTSVKSGRNGEPGSEKETQLNNQKKRSTEPSLFFGVGEGRKGYIQS